MNFIFNFKKQISKFINNFNRGNIYDAGNSSKSSNRDLYETAVKRVGLRHGDVTSKDFEEPEFDLKVISLAYNSDAYVRQGVDKYVDQIMKEGYDFYSKNENAVAYVKLRLDYMAEATKTPTRQLLIEICEDIVKYSNCIVVKARAKDQNSLPPNTNVSGIGGREPIAGYFCLNATTIKVKRDKNGTVLGYQQEVDGADKAIKFKAEDVVHFHYKKEKGYAFGTPFLMPVIDDVRALRQAEENVLRMMYRNIHPFLHISVGDNETPGTETEIEGVKDEVNNMEVEGGLVTSNRVVIKPIATDKVIDASPYLSYLEQRVFSDMGIPAILFGRGDTSNRSTGDNMTSEMYDRIKAMQRAIEDVYNNFIIKEILLEGGFDTVLNPDDNVVFKFKENDLDSMIKLENHIIYKFEHNAITEDEMRAMLSLDPISDRSLLCRELNKSASNSGSDGDDEQGTKETNNKNRPTNQHGTKQSPKKTTDSYNGYSLVDEVLDNLKRKENGNGI